MQESNSKRMKFERKYHPNDIWIWLLDTRSRVGQLNYSYECTSDQIDTWTQTFVSDKWNNFFQLFWLHTQEMICSLVNEFLVFLCSPTLWCIFFQIIHDTRDPWVKWMFLFFRLLKTLDETFVDRELIYHSDLVSELVWFDRCIQSHLVIVLNKCHSWGF